MNCTSYYTPTGQTYTISAPELSEWQVTLFPGTVLRPLKGKEPCWFHRKMQEWCFGFRWERA